VAAAARLDDAEFEDERAEAREGEGRERLRAWGNILSPRFDNPSSRMPDLGLTEEEADSTADYLLQGRERTTTAVRRLFRTLFGAVSPTKAASSASSAGLGASSLSTVSGEWS
jgi:hypothetical protein